MSTDEPNFLPGLKKKKSQLSKEEVELLEHEIFKNVVSKFRNYILVSVFIITGAGIVSFSNIKNSIQEKVVTNLSQDEKIRRGIDEKIELELEEVEDLKKQSKELLIAIQRDRTEANLILENNLEEIIVMLEKIDQISNN